MKTRSRKWLSNILLILCVLQLIGGISVLVYWYADSMKDEQELHRIECIYEEDERNDDTITTTEKKMPTNCVAWLKILDTKVSFPVMQKEGSPLYYIHKDAYGNYSYSGVPFLDDNCNIEESKNLIIYGHNMRNGTMFSRLMSFKEISYCKNHNTIQLTINGEKVEYDLYAVAKVKDDDLWYSFTDDVDENTFENLISHIKDKSLYLSDKEIKYGDYFITLSTCEYSQTNGRLILIGTRSESNV